MRSMLAGFVGGPGLGAVVGTAAVALFLAVAWGVRRLGQAREPADRSLYDSAEALALEERRRETERRAA